MENPYVPRHISREYKKLGQSIPVPMLKKGGREFNLYDAIQEATEGTNLYAVLEKYGSIRSMELDLPNLYADISEFKDLRNTMDQLHKAEEMWLNLPIETRRKYGHDKREFIEKGMDDLKKEYETQKAAEAAAAEPKTE
jgi:hypothetical protein